MKNQFSAIIDRIGINPFVYVPDKILADIFTEAAKKKGPVPVKGTINGHPFRQTLVRYKGVWRLYINTTILKDSPKRIGEEIVLTLVWDAEERKLTAHPKLLTALKNNTSEAAVFNKLSPSLQKEIIKYFSFLKTEQSVDRNIEKMLAFLSGNGRFVGRDCPL